MNNKGFSLIEVMTTFILSTTILLMLVELLLGLKDIYKTGDVKTTLLVNQANIERRIYDDIFKSKVLKIEACGTNCLTFTTDFGIKTLQRENNQVIYDNYRMRIAKGSNIGDITFQAINQTLNGTPATIYQIDMPLTNRLVEGDYGIHIITQVSDDLY